MAVSQSPPSPPEPPVPGSHYQPALGVVLVIVALFIAATFLMLRSPGVASLGPSATTTTTTTIAHSGVTTTSLPTKAQVRVQVANGTNTTGLARTFTQQLQTLGWDTLPQVNAAKVSATIIYYNPGYLWAAQQIAGEIKASSSAIQPLIGLRPVAGASGDDVIVILGPDLAVKG
jgi:hypothetical protein